MNRLYAVVKASAKRLPPLLGFLRGLDELVRHHPLGFTLLICFIYLGVFQTAFVSSGDTWAEAFYEYVHGAVANGWQGFFHTGIAGYFNFWPKLLSYPYVIWGWPIQYIDYYFRFVVIAYTVGCIAFIAHPYNRSIIKNDHLRCLLALMTLMTLYHVSSFSFINVWYAGFIPLVFVSISPHRFRNEVYQILYAVFALSVCLTKPSIIFLPLIIYRAVRYKEYLLGSIIGFAIGLQTLLFFTSNFYDLSPPAVHVGAVHKITNMALYSGIVGMKLFQVYIHHLWAVGLSAIAIGVLVILVAKARGLAQTGVLGLTFLLAIYTAIYPPDTPIGSVRNTYWALLHDQFKLQREVLISFFILFFLIITVEFLLHLFAKRGRRWGKWPALAIAGCLVILAVLEYRSIDVQSAKLHVSIDSFRPSLRAREDICMPVAPTQTWTTYEAKPMPVFGWYYENGAIGGCITLNYDKIVDVGSFTRPIERGLDISFETPNASHINALVIPVWSKNPDTSHTLILENLDTHAMYSFVIQPKSNNDHLNYVSFSLSHEQAEVIYRYRLTEPQAVRSDLTTGSFTDGGLITFPYFLPNR